MNLKNCFQASIKKFHIPENTSTILRAYKNVEFKSKRVNKLRSIEFKLYSAPLHVHRNKFSL